MTGFVQWKWTFNCELMQDLRWGASGGGGEAAEAAGIRDGGNLPRHARHRLKYVDLSGVSRRPNKH